MEDKTSTKKTEKKSVTKKLLHIFIVGLIIFQSFFPIKISEASNLVWFILFLVIGVVLFMAVIAPQFIATPGVQDTGNLFSILNVIVDLFIIIILLAITQFFNCGTSSCYELMSRRLGTSATLIIIVGLAIVGVVFALILDDVPFYIFAVIFGFVCFVLIPFVTQPQQYFKICKQIPLISDSILCMSREVSVKFNAVNIPVSGGVGLKFMLGETLYAGEPYEFSFSMTNYYDEPISFSLTPSIVSTYGQKLEFVLPSYKPRKEIPELNKSETYDDSVFMDPQEMVINKQSSACPYTVLQIAAAQNIPSKDVECSSDRSCIDPEKGCARIDVFDCKCVDWTDATCSGYSLRAKMNVKHTGFFKGNASLYYSDKITSPKPAVALVQGPLSVVIDLQPNPYISTIHQYRQDVSVYAILTNQGGDITIRSLDIYPVTTEIHTIDRESQKELVEVVGSQKIGCRDINELLPGGVLKSGTEISGKLCTITPPYIKTTLIDLSNDTVVEVNGVTFDSISNYCNNVKPTIEEGKTSVYWSVNWDKIYQTIKESGICEILKGKDTKEKEIVKESLAYAQVVVDLRYDVDANYFSQYIYPYTGTEKCKPSTVSGTT